MYDAAGVIVTSSAAAKKFIYTIKLKRRIAGYSFTTGTAYIIAPNTSTVQVNGPSAPGGIASSAPMTGNFVISCTDKNGAVHKSPAISHTQWDEGIRVQVLENMPYLRGKVAFYDTWTGDAADAWKFSYRENGRSLIAVFNGFKENPPLCTLENDTTTPTVGNNIRFVSEVLRPYGQSLMFEPVGLEFLYSDAQKPQVLVDVDGLPALCLNLNCDYSYIAASAEITAQTFDASTLQLTVTGTSLPTSGLSVHFGGAYCSDSPAPTFTANQI